MRKNEKWKRVRISAQWQCPEISYECRYVSKYIFFIFVIILCSVPLIQDTDVLQKKTNDLTNARAGNYLVLKFPSKQNARISRRNLINLRWKRLSQLGWKVERMCGVVRGRWEYDRIPYINQKPKFILRFQYLLAIYYNFRANLSIPLLRDIIIIIMMVFKDYTNLLT